MSILHIVVGRRGVPTVIVRWLDLEIVKWLIRIPQPYLLDARGHFCVIPGIHIVHATRITKLAIESVRLGI